MKDTKTALSMTDGLQAPTQFGSFCLFLSIIFMFFCVGGHIVYCLLLVYESLNIYILFVF